MNFQAAGGHDFVPQRCGYASACAKGLLGLTPPRQVSQLDAALLDEELASLFMHKLRSACKHVRQGAFSA